MFGLPPFEELYEPLGREEAEKDYRKTLTNCKRLIAEYEDRSELADWKPPNLAAIARSVKPLLILIAAILIIISNAPKIAAFIRDLPAIKERFSIYFLEPWGGATDYWDTRYEVTQGFDTKEGCAIKIDGKWADIPGRSTDDVLIERELYQRACETEDWSEYTGYMYNHYLPGEWVQGDDGMWYQNGS